LVKLDPALLFVQLLTFGLAVFLLWRFFWKPLARFMGARSAGIERDLTEAQKQRADAAALLALAEEEGRKNRAEVIREAQAEARRMLENASRQIAEEKVRAIRELRAETINLAALMAEKALKQSLDPELQRRLVDEFARELADG
jgi:F-type H+-transporting ATPase subunit b